MSTKNSLRKIASIKTSIGGHWVTLGTIQCNYDATEPARKWNAVVWLGGWIQGLAMAFPEPDAKDRCPHLHGTIACRLIEGTEGAEDFYQTVGWIATRTKDGPAGTDDEIEFYSIRLSVLPLTQRQLCRKNQVGMYFSIRDEEPTPGDGPERAFAGHPPTETDTQPMPMEERPDEQPPREQAQDEDEEPIDIRIALKIVNDFDSLHGLFPDDIEQFVGKPKERWTPADVDQIRILFKHLNTWPSGRARELIEKRQLGPAKLGELIAEDIEGPEPPKEDQVDPKLDRKQRAQKKREARERKEKEKGDQ